MRVTANTEPTVNVVTGTSRLGVSIAILGSMGPFTKG